MVTEVQRVLVEPDLTIQYSRLRDSVSETGTMTRMSRSFSPGQSDFDLPSKERSIV